LSSKNRLNPSSPLLIFVNRINKRQKLDCLGWVTTEGTAAFLIAIFFAIAVATRTITTVTTVTTVTIASTIAVTTGAITTVTIAGAIAIAIIKEGKPKTTIVAKAKASILATILEAVWPTITVSIPWTIAVFGIIIAIASFVWIIIITISTISVLLVTVLVVILAVIFAVIFAVILAVIFLVIFVITLVAIITAISVVVRIVIAVEIVIGLVFHAARFLLAGLKEDVGINTKVADELVGAVQGLLS